MPSIFAASIKMVGSGLPLPSRIGSSPQRMLVEKQSKRWPRCADFIKKFFFFEPVAIWRGKEGISQGGGTLTKRPYAPPSGPCASRGDARA